MGSLICVLTAYVKFLSLDRISTSHCIVFIRWLWVFPHLSLVPGLQFVQAVPTVAQRQRSVGQMAMMEHGQHGWSLAGHVCAFFPDDCSILGRETAADASSVGAFQTPRVFPVEADPEGGSGIFPLSMELEVGGA